MARHTVMNRLPKMARLVSAVHQRSFQVSIGGWRHCTRRHDCTMRDTDTGDRFEIGEFTLEVPAGANVYEVHIIAPAVLRVTVVEPRDRPACTRRNGFAIGRFQFMPGINRLPDLE